jgi:hypothetical protein
MSDEALTYLQGDSRGPKRDLIARCYYEVAQGDPKSGPVVFAVLSNAAAEQFAKTPEELRETNECLRLLLAEARDFEKKLRDRVETSNAAVILSFKDETRRAREAWQETINQAEYVRERAKLLAHDMEAVITSAKRIASDFSTLKGDLKLHHESTKTIAEGVADVKAIHQNNRDLVKYFVKQARFNWLTIGFLGGIIFNSIANEIPAPHWLPLVVFAVGAGWLQWLFREFWIYLRSRTEKTSSAAQTKSTG